MQSGNAFIPAGPNRQGFDDWHVWERTNAHYASFKYDSETGERQQPEGWNCTLMTDQAVDIIRRQKKDKPWMMVMSWNPPHFPFDPPAEDAEPYPVGSLPMRPNVRLSLEGQNAQGIARVLTGDAELRRSMRGYYGAITGLDDAFARLLKVPEETGQADNTIVVYTSDHGEMMGSHGRMAKSMPFEESVRVPFYVRVPGVTRATKSSALFASIDVFPTMCGLAGVPVPRQCVGRDLSVIIRGEGAPPSLPVFLMNELGGTDGGNDEGGGAERGAAQRGRRGGRLAANGGALGAGPGGGPHFEVVTQPSYRGVKTERHTYAIADTGRWCLFDNVADPYQAKNLIRDPAHTDLMARLDRTITPWLQSSGDPFPLAELVKRISNVPA